MAEHNDETSVIHALCDHYKATDREAMTYASVAAYVQNQNEMVRTGRRAQAQVDAMLQAKFEACGLPDVYKPPAGDEDDMSTLINCNFWGDESVTQVASAITASQKKTADGKTEPVKPVEPVTPENGKKPWTLAKAAMLGAALLITGGASALITQWLTPNPSTPVVQPGDYAVKAIPYEPAGATMQGTK